MLQANTIPYEEIQLPLLQEKGVRLTVKRLDQVHEQASGNKFFKLKYNLEEAKKQGKTKVLTFGGAFSNHIYATAAAAQAEGLSAIGIIRGEETLPLNPTLAFAQAAGMQLQYMDRSSYRTKHSEEILEMLRKQWGDFYMVPEGGTNALAIQGTCEILETGDEKYSHIACSIGTGGTFAGLAGSIHSNQTLWGFSSLKGDFIHKEIAGLLDTYGIKSAGKWTIFDRYHFGGYAKFYEELLAFMRGFFEQTGIPLDPVYTGKMAYGLIQEIQSGSLKEGSHVLLIHSGGLQGIQGFEWMYGKKLYDSLSM